MRCCELYLRESFVSALQNAGFNFALALSLQSIKNLPRFVSGGHDNRIFI